MRCEFPRVLIRGLGREGRGFTRSPGRPACGPHSGDSGAWPGHGKDVAWAPAGGRASEAPPHPLSSAAPAGLEGGRPKAASCCPGTGPTSPADAAMLPAQPCSWTSPGVRWASPPGPPLPTWPVCPGTHPSGKSAWPHAYPSASSASTSKVSEQTIAKIVNCVREDWPDCVRIPIIKPPGRCFQRGHIVS